MIAVRPRTALCVPMMLATALACSSGERAASGDTSAAAPAAAAGAPAASSSESGAGPITTADLRDYRLTMDRVRAVHAADLEWKRSGGTFSDGPQDETPTATANRVWRDFEKDPKGAAFVRKSGMTAREVAIHSVVYLHTAMVMATGQQAPEVAKENVDFVKANMAELTRMNEEAQAAAKGSGGQ